MLPEGCVSGAVAGSARSLSSWSVVDASCYNKRLGGELVETYDECRCSCAAGSGELVGIMALLGCCSCAAMNNVGDLALKNLFIVELLTSVAARVCDYCKIDCFEAAAAAAAFVSALAHTFQAEPAACAQMGFFKIFQTQAAVARAAAADASHSFEMFLGCVFETFWWMLAFVWYDVGSHMLWILLRTSGKESWTFPGLWKEQKDSMVEEKVEDTPIPQASIREAVIANDDSMCFDGHVEFKGKDRHDTDGSLSLGFGEASGRVDVPVSVYKLIDPACMSPQSVVVNQSLRVEKTIFMKGLDGRTTIHRVSDDMMIGEILNDWMVGLDVMVSFNGKVIGMHDTVRDLGIERDCTLRCSGRVRGGAQRYRQPQPDIPGQWTCSVCFQERVWPVRNRCFRCGAPKGRDPAPSVRPYVVGPTGRQPQRSNPVNPTKRTNQRQPQPVVPSASVQSFPPLNQPVPTGRVETSGTGGVPAFPAGNLD